MKETQKNKNTTTSFIKPESIPKAIFHESEKENELQNAFNLVTIEKERLEKENRTLEEQRNKFIKLHSEEKEEKNEFINKYETLQTQYTEKIESFGNERLKFTKKYYSLLVLCVVALLILLVIVFPNILALISKS